MFEKQKMFIFGMARSGYEVAKLLLKRNCSVFVFDSKEQDKNHVEEIEALGGKVIITDSPEEYLDDSFDYMVKNPGIRKDHVCVAKARTLGIPVINEVELAFHLLPKCKIIGVTGSNGKTTTTTLIYNILKEAHLPVHLGGNIGYPLASLVSMVKENDIVLLEISDHQLCDMYDFKTDISVFMNVSPTHLDFHDSYDTYKRMKMRIFNHHTSLDLAIVNASCTEEMELVSSLPDRIQYFRGKDAYQEEGKIIVPNYLCLSIHDLKVTGEHNYENMMAALLVAKELQVEPSICENVLKNFSGVEHRIEYVLEKDGIRVFNDSKSTNNVATITALKSFDANVILLMGGLDRGQSYVELLPYMSVVKKVICFGETKEKIKEFCLQNSIVCESVDTLIEATHLAFSFASKGDIILLSPAHASWDQFKSFEERGKQFKEEVMKLTSQA